MSEPLPPSGAGCSALPCALFAGALGQAVEAWRRERAPVELWLRGPGRALAYARGGPHRLDLRCWSGSTLLASASIRGEPGAETLCAERGLSLDGVAPGARAQAAFDALSHCSERCSPAPRPGWLRRATLG